MDSKYEFTEYTERVGPIRWQDSFVEQLCGGASRSSSTVTDGSRTMICEMSLSRKQKDRSEKNPWRTISLLLRIQS